MIASREQIKEAITELESVNFHSGKHLDLAIAILRQVEAGELVEVGKVKPVERLATEEEIFHAIKNFPNRDIALTDSDDGDIRELAKLLLGRVTADTGKCYERNGGER